MQRKCDFGYSRPMNVIQQAARDAIKQHGGVTKAAGALRINRTVLRLLADGQRDNASPETIKRLGLKIVAVRPENVP